LVAWVEARQNVIVWDRLCQLGFDELSEAELLA
jgi:hypothetical protein